MSEYRYVFGPVPSRRLGFSLGIDLVPFKTCSYDCIYCQLGRTTAKTTARKEYVPLDAVIMEVERKLKGPGTIDYLTLSGSGEPTLYAPLGELVAAIKRLTAIPVAVLTNGSLLWDPEVQKGLAGADLIVPSLDAGSDFLYQYVNRPCWDLPFEKVKNGIIEFSSQYREKIWLEVFLLDGVTAIEAEARKLNAIISLIKPAKVQLNTVKRPPAEEFAFAVSGARMRELAVFFDGNVEIIADFNRPAEAGHGENMKSGIIALLKRRPCSVNDLAGCLNLHPNEIVKYLEELEKSVILVTERGAHDVYYSIKQ